MAKAERNPAIELYRCLLMFGICWLHAITLGTQRSHPLAGILMCCVPGFVFISGWFGISFKPSKLIKLYGVGAWCAAIVVLVARYFGSIPAEASLVNEWVDLYTKRYWFLHAYAALMLLAPLVNAAVYTPPLKSEEDGRRLWAAILPLFILIFGWAYLMGAPVMHKLPWPQTPGLGSNTALTLLGVYAFAAVCRKTHVLERLTGKMSLFLSGCCVFLCCLSFGNYHSIIASALAAIAFWQCSKIKMSPMISRAIVFIAPSMFSVYLLHSTGVIFQLIGSVESMVMSRGYPMIAVAFVVGIALFVLCTMLDVLRRALLAPVSPVVRSVSSRIDQTYDDVISRLAKVSTDYRGVAMGEKLCKV